MLIQITEVFIKNSDLKVKFSSDFGTGIALWHHTPPKIGEMHDIELEIDEIFTIGVNAKLKSNATETINTTENQTKITAKIISAQPNFTTLKVGSSIIFIELKNPPCTPPKYIELSFKSLKIYPTNI